VAILAVSVGIIATLAACGGEQQPVTSADKLLARAGVSGEQPAVAAQQPPPPPTGRRNATAPKAVRAKLLKSGSRRGPKVVAIAFQLRATPGNPGGVDPTLLNALRTDEATATFFMAGLWAEANPRAAAEIARLSGVEIGNGGYSSEYLRRLPVEVTRVRTQLAQESIRKATGSVPRVYRNAQGGYTSQSTSAIARLGLRPVSGDVDLTAASSGLSAAGVAQAGLAKVLPGSIIILPGDGADSRTVGVLIRLLAGLKRRGFELVTVSALKE
jgi:peptidoglycan/xylan/chitin deacetylase (PgdA/CDA1 family)